MLPQILKINWRVHTSEQDLDLLLVEHATNTGIRSTYRYQKYRYPPKPFSIYQLQKTLEERLALQLYLFTEAVMRYQLDILQTILLGDGFVAPVGNEVKSFGDSEFWRYNARSG
jgi:hypothetical protein